MLIDGKGIAAQIQEEIKAAVSRLVGRQPCLAVIQTGDHAPSQIYINRKIAACEYVGIRSYKLQFPSTVTESELLHQLTLLNKNELVDGILVQLPLPQTINPHHIIESIDPEKDVDGFHPMNMGKLLNGAKDGFISCTPLGIKELLLRSEIEVAGKHVVILGRSNIVGKPLAALLMQNQLGGNATVSVVHSWTGQKDFDSLCRQADVLIAAIGAPRKITGHMIKEGVVIVDVGINKIPDPGASCGYRIVGDVDFDSVKDKCFKITPVPGGVGPMTIAMLLSNTLRSFLQRSKQ